MIKQKKLSDAFIRTLIQTAEEPCPYLDDPNYDSYGGGDSSDDVEAGIDAGRVEMARKVLDKLGIKYEIYEYEEDEE